MWNWIIFAPLCLRQTNWLVQNDFSATLFISHFYNWAMCIWIIWNAAHENKMCQWIEIHWDFCDQTSDSICEPDCVVETSLAVKSCKFPEKLYVMNHHLTSPFLQNPIIFLTSMVLRWMAILMSSLIWSHLVCRSMYFLRLFYWKSNICWVILIYICSSRTIYFQMIPPAVSKEFTLKAEHWCVIFKSLNLYPDTLAQKVCHLQLWICIDK